MRKSIFWLNFRRFLGNLTKAVTFLMHYNELHHWSKFQANLTIFQWVISKKPPKSGLKLYFLLVGNIWNFKTRELQIRHKWNLTQICINWTPLIYQNIRVSINGQVRRGGDAFKKPPENAMKLRESQLLHHLKRTQTMLKRRGFLLPSITIWL